MPSRLQSYRDSRTPLDSLLHFSTTGGLNMSFWDAFDMPARQEDEAVPNDTSTGLWAALDPFLSSMGTDETLEPVPMPSGTDIMAEYFATGGWDTASATDRSTDGRRGNQRATIAGWTVSDERRAERDEEAAEVRRRRRDHDEAMERERQLVYAAAVALNRQVRARQRRNQLPRANEEDNDDEEQVPSYLLELACEPSPHRRAPRARTGFLELARRAPDCMLRYNSRRVILPDAYLEEPATSRALQLLNPYQLDCVRTILPVDLVLAIEDGNQEYVEREILQDGGDRLALWCCRAYGQHMRALTVLAERFRLGNPYELQEYRDLMSEREGARRVAWRGIERRREQREAMTRELVRL